LNIATGNYRLLLLHKSQNSSRLRVMPLHRGIPISNSGIKLRIIDGKTAA
jgi:hypothetical protein